MNVIYAIFKYITSAKIFFPLDYKGKTALGSMLHLFDPTNAIIEA